jgi:hypothetical protein
MYVLGDCIIRALLRSTVCCISRDLRIGKFIIVSVPLKNFDYVAFDQIRVFWKYQDVSNYFLTYILNY